jgi:hypothetical protein
MSVLTKATRRQIPGDSNLPVRYELEFCIPEDGILHSHRRENLRSHIALTEWVLQRRRNVFPVRYELGFSISYDGIILSDRRENLKSHISLTELVLQRRHNVFPVRYELGFSIPEDGVLYSHRRETLKPYLAVIVFQLICSWPDSKAPFLVTDI